MNIYVGNLALDTTEEELRQKFRVFGEVISTTIMNDKYIGSGQSMGYGYVEMVARSEGETAINSLKGARYRDLVIDVMEALPLSDKKGAVDIIGKNSKWAKQKRRQRKY